MNPDFTYCTGLRCDRKEQCKRWVGHLKSTKEETVFMIERRIEIDQFADHAGRCEKFLEIEGK